MPETEPDKEPVAAVTTGMTIVARAKRSTLLKIKVLCRSKKNQNVL